jgi:hypothetical protein
MVFHVDDCFVMEDNPNSLPKVNTTVEGCDATAVEGKVNVGPNLFPDRH